MKVKSLNKNSGTAIAAVPEINTQIGKYNDLLFATQGYMEDFDWHYSAMINGYMSSLYNSFGQNIPIMKVDSTTGVFLKKTLQQEFSKVFVAMYFYDRDWFSVSVAQDFICYKDRNGTELYKVSLFIYSGKLTVWIKNCKTGAVSFNSAACDYGSAKEYRIEVGIDLKAKKLFVCAANAEIIVPILDCDDKELIKALNFYGGAYYRLGNVIISQSRIGVLRVKKIGLADYGDRKEFTEVVIKKTMGNYSYPSGLFSFKKCPLVLKYPFTCNGKISRIVTAPWGYPVQYDIYIAEKLANGSFILREKIQEMSIASSNYDVAIFNMNDVTVNKGQYLALVLTVGSVYYGSSSSSLLQFLYDVEITETPTGEFIVSNAYENRMCFAIDFTPTEAPILGQDTGYISGSKGQKQLYNVENLPDNVSVDIKGVAVTGRIAGDGLNNAMGMIKSGTTEEISPAALTPVDDATIVSYQAVFSENPETGAAFTKEDFNNLQIGIAVE